MTDDESHEWLEVKELFTEHGCPVLDKPEIKWYQESWCALKHAHLLSADEFEDEELNEVVVKLRAVCLLVMYLGIYQVAGHTMLGGFFDAHVLSWYLSSLEIETTVLRQIGLHGGVIEASTQAGIDDTYADVALLEEVASVFVEEQNTSIYVALKEHYSTCSLVSQRSGSDVA